MPDDRRLEILADLLKTAERNFEAAAKHSATIDDKAQKTSALAGVLVAFGFIKPEGLAALQQRFRPFGIDSPLRDPRFTYSVRHALSSGHVAAQGPCGRDIGCRA